MEGLPKRKLKIYYSFVCLLRLLLVDSFGVSFKIRVPETVRVGTTLKVTIHTCFRCDFSLGGWSSSWPYRRAGEDFCKKCWHARV